MTSYEGHYPHDPKKRKRFHDTDGNIDKVQVALFVFLLFSIIVSMSVLYLVFLEDNPPVVFNEVKLVNDTAEPGGHVSFFIDFCKNTTSAPDRRREWVDGLLYLVPGPDDPPSNAPGCYQFPNTVSVPDVLPPGEYWLFNTFTFRVNPLAERTVEYKAGPFYIIDLENEAGNDG